MRATVPGAEGTLPTEVQKQSCPGSPKPSCKRVGAPTSTGQLWHFPGLITPQLLPSAHLCPFTWLISNLFLERTPLTLTIALKSRGCSFPQVPLRRWHDQNYHQEEHLTFSKYLIAIY